MNISPVDFISAKISNQKTNNLIQNEIVPFFNRKVLSLQSLIIILYNMAQPIAETPTISGKDALRFMQAMANVKPISKKDREQMKKDYQLVKSWATFKL